jgi:hypothetical protein
MSKSDDPRKETSGAAMEAVESSGTSIEKNPEQESDSKVSMKKDSFFCSTKQTVRVPSKQTNSMLDIVLNDFSCSICILFEFGVWGLIQRNSFDSERLVRFRETRSIQRDSNIFVWGDDVGYENPAEKYDLGHFAGRVERFADGAEWDFRGTFNFIFVVKIWSHLLRFHEDLYCCKTTNS